MKDEGIFSKAELTGILSTNQIEIVCFRQYLWEESLTHFDFLESTTPILKKHIDTLSGSSHWIISDSVWFDWVLDWVFLIARVRICFARAQTCFTYQVVAHLFVFRTVTATFALTSFLTIVATFSWRNSENVFFFCLGFLSRTFTNHRTAEEGGGHLVSERKSLTTKLRTLIETSDSLIQVWWIPFARTFDTDVVW